ncbi:GNAT family N-acetyltransferase [Microcoleus sp. LEGE 07076]|uniref:GNAT family N-acetyltransferase n=1 Tax=Microcoleus sp. LEGE 07076 TaxID=915322 RepID=UPI0018814738|nr:GNAT family N-acetyltransferase [Microcoleus sp. LEGE 07076]MBE9186399.1 GNAT family N-acetyltransferase [Microcoleus sp. LEGE 07076]
MKTQHLDFLIRSWETRDRAEAFYLIRDILVEYGLKCEPFGADRDVYDVELFYHKNGGEFWVVERQEEIVGTAAYYPIERGKNAVEIRKMYILPTARRQGLGKFLLQELESKIMARGFDEIWIETASILKEAVILYEKNGYLPATGVETPRCDRVYVKCLG